MKMISHHLLVYRHLLSYSLKYMLTYRLNLLIQLAYTIIYYFMQFSVITVVFHQTTTLGGWNRAEALLLFWVYITLYNFADALFLRGAYMFMQSGIQMGDFDRALTKPLRSSFLVMFGTPRVHILLITLFGLVMSLKLFAELSVSWWHLLSFVGISVISVASAFFILSLYATSAFYLTKSVQIFHTFEKVTDFSQYPTHIFPKAIELTFMTIFPVALFGYLPTLFLLGRGTFVHVGMLVVILVSSYLLQKLFWHIGIKRYSSVSS